MPLDPIKGVWHPIVQLECVRMNAEAQMPDDNMFANQLNLLEE